MFFSLFLKSNSFIRTCLSQSVQSLSHIWLFETPWTAARQASLSITNSRSPPKPMSIESVMPSNHLILLHPFLLLPSIFPSIRVFSNESALSISWFLRVHNLGVRQHCFHRHVLTGLFNLLEAWKESESVHHLVVSDSATPWDCSPPGSSVHGILQARILEWVAKSFSRGSSWPGIEPVSLMSPALACWFFTISTTWEAHAGHIYLFHHIFLNWMLNIINFTFLRTGFYCFKIVRICLADKLFGDKMNPFKLGL